MNQKAMYKLSYGLFVLTAKEGAKDNGCIVNTVQQVTTSPNQILVAVNKQNYTHDMIQHTGLFNVSVLTEKSRFATFQNFGFQSGRTADKFAKVSFARSENGLVYLPEETNAYLSAKVRTATDLGTHTLFLAEVTDAQILGTDPSVTYAYYQKQIKPAPDVAAKKTGWICTICGYIYEGEELPADFVCPICKHGAADFEKLS